jgi:hypothetical protein
VRLWLVVVLAPVVLVAPVVAPVGVRLPVRTSLRLFAPTLFLDALALFVLAPAIFCPPDCFLFASSLLLALALKS